MHMLPVQHADTCPNLLPLHRGAASGAALAAASPAAACFYNFTVKPCLAGSPTNAAFDEKNIRRRVYDALNVLMAMDIISKDKKEIRWQGLPSAPADRAERLRADRSRLRARLLQQHAYLRVRSLLLSCFTVAAASISCQ